MNVRVEELSSIKKKLFVEVDADVVAAELDSAYKKIAKTANIKGFRKGKVPKSILQQQFGFKAQYDATGPLINNSLYKAMIDNNIEAVSQPEVVNTGTVEEGQSFTYEAEVEVRPEIVAKDYTGLELEKEKFVFDEGSVDYQLQHIAESRAQLEVTSRKLAREGDTVIIDFVGYVDGTAFENGSAEDYQLELGSSSFIPGFEDQVAGMKREQEKEISVAFPENYGAKDLAGKDAVFKVTLKEIKEKVTPKIDDDLAKEMEAETLEELKEKIKENTITQETRRVNDQLQENMMTALIEKNEFEVPEGMIQNQLHYLKDSFSQRLKAQGMTLEMLGMNDEAFANNYRPMAEMQVKGELLLDAIAKQEELDVEDSEVEERIKSFADESNTPLEQVQKYFENPQAMNGLKGQLLSEKVSKFIIDQAVVTEVEPKQPETEEAGEEAGNTEEKES
ncbi:MAG: trigger factor [Desulfuromonas sp.]|mgnify:CR=1 FL=1|nr:MAG: trigger factor [Desulfuromonas sp.]